jgi:hypothetical protein
MATLLWKSRDVLDRLNRLDRSAFAIALLRRNAAYRRDYARTLRQIAGGGVDPDKARSDLAHRWGLRFCPRSRRARRG